LKDNNIYVLKDLGEQQLSETQKDILKLLEQNECPYIVKHYTLNKTNCIKTDFINDIDLLDYLNTYIDLENPIEEKVLWKIFRQCIESVKYLHEKNIVHRNIRLENFYITDDKEIKLGNFRYATLINEAKEDMNYPEEGILYKSAETLNKDIYNKKSDLYALGVVFYKLCYFEFPYDITYKSNKEDDSKGIYQLNPIPKKELGYSKELNELINSLLNIFTQKVEEEKIYQMAINKPLEYKCKNTCIESIIRCLSPFSFFLLKKSQ
jgi:serine/threonine protein kinase